MLRAKTLLLAVAFGWLALGVKADDPPGKAKSKFRPTIEARFTDGSTFKVSLRDEAIELITPYGRLRVPTHEIRRVEMATRTPPELAERIAVWIADLGSPQFSVRDAAQAELSKVREQAYHALVAATKLKDAEIVKRATELVKMVKEQTPEEQLALRPFDVITTIHSKIAGRIDAAGLRADTTQFGEVFLKLTDLRSLRTGTDNDETAVAVIDDPGNLGQFQNRIGAVLAIRVRGNAAGSIWGSDVYTYDSPLATAAVHAGLLQAGQTGVVRVKIVASPPNYQGSTRHGVTSSQYGFYAFAYEFVKKAADD